MENEIIGRRYIMKNILVLGSTGRIGRLLVPMLTGNDNEITLFVRNPDKARELGLSENRLVQGDVTDTVSLSESMNGQDIVVAVLDGDLLAYAKSITAALKENRIERVIWMTGMGIHHEVPGVTGKMLDMLVKKMPQYVEAADLIADSGTPYTLVRGAHLTDGKNDKYFVQHEGEKLHSNKTDRIAVARFIADIIESGNGVNESLGVTN